MRRPDLFRAMVVLATPTILTGDNTQNPGEIEVVSVPYPVTIPTTGGFFRVVVSMP